MDADILQALTRWDDELHECLAGVEPGVDDWDGDLALLRQLAVLGQGLVDLVVLQRDRLGERLDDG